MHFHCIIFSFNSPNVYQKHEGVNYFIVLGFWKSFLKASYKDPKVASGEWHSRDVPRTSTLNISTKRISVVIFLFLVHQMCVLDIKKLVIAYSFSFGETSYERPKHVSKRPLQRDVLNLNNFYKRGFKGNFSMFPDAKCIPDIAEPK